MLGQFTLLCPTCWWTGLRWISMHSCNVPDEVAKMQLTVNESIEIIEILSEGFDVTFHTLLLRIGVAAWHLKWVPAVKHVWSSVKPCVVPYSSGGCSGRQFSQCFCKLLLRQLHAREGYWLASFIDQQKGLFAASGFFGNPRDVKNIYKVRLIPCLREQTRFQEKGWEVTKKLSLPHDPASYRSRDSCWDTFNSRRIQYEVQAIICSIQVLPLARSPKESTLNRDL